jgi:hypothetical protein
MDRGGAVILSGWDMMAAFVDTAASGSFSSGFVYNYLRITDCRENTPNDFTGLNASLTGYPDLAVDATKLPPAFRGSLPRCWIMTPAHRAASVGGFKSGSENPIFNGKSACVINTSIVNSWRSLVIGFPLYFVEQESAKEFITHAVADLTQ